MTALEVAKCSRVGVQSSHDTDNNSPGNTSSCYARKEKPTALKCTDCCACEFQTKKRNMEIIRSKPATFRGISDWSFCAWLSAMSRICATEVQIHTCCRNSGQNDKNLTNRKSIKRTQIYSAQVKRKNSTERKFWKAICALLDVVYN